MDSIETGNAGPAEPDKPRTPLRRKTKSKETVVGADAPHWATQPPPPVALVAPPGTAKPMTAPKPKRLENPKAKANKAANEQLVIASMAAAAQGVVLAPEVTQNERDAALMRHVGGTTSIMRTRPVSDLTRDEAVKLSTGDIGAIGAIQDQQTRSMALVAAEESRKAQPLYKTEFDRQAPALAVEAETAARRAGPRSAEAERAHWLNKRAEDAALGGMTNTIEQAPARTVAASVGVVPGVEHDATALPKEMVAGPAQPLKNAGQLAGETPVAGGPASKAVAADDPIRGQTMLFRSVAGDAEYCMIGPDGGVEPATAVKMVGGHLSVLRKIHDEHLRNLTTNAIWDAAHAQQNYRAELAAQSPAVFASYASQVNKVQFLASVQPAIDAECNKQTVDAIRLRAIAATGERMELETRGKLSADNAMAVVAADLAALRAIEHGETRRLALLVMERSQVAQVQYREALTTQAPEIGVESDLAYKLQLKQQGAQPDLTGFAARLAAEPPSAPAVDRTTAVPESVAKRFLKVDNDYFFPSEKTPAFIDRGTKLATRGENRMVINSLAEIAKARGWDHIAVGGTEEFRREAWLAASLVGIQVDGYKPTELEKADLARRPSGNSIEQVAERMKAEPPTVPLVKSAEPVEQAASQLTKVQMADLRAKAASFANDKPSFVVKKYPDLAPAYGTLSAAAMFAAEHLPGNEDRFAKVAREALVDMIARGETVPAPDLSQGASKAPTQERGRNQAKGDELQRSR